MSQTMTIFQLGDVHYPEFESARTEVDLHDEREPGNVSHSLALPVSQRVRESLVSEMARSENFAVAICGDLTTRANRSAYVSALIYLSDVLKHPKVADAVDLRHVHLVPGNHDVAFKSDQPFVSFDDHSRFSIQETLCREELGDVFSTSYRSSTLRSGANSLTLMSVNTCRGAGASRRTITGMASDELLEVLIARNPGDSIESLHAELEKRGDLHEILDVPLLHPIELGKIADEASGADPDSIPVVIAHHGLLPQSTPRLNPYTEMANSGQARREFQKIRRPLIYLHGHIHSDVVEVIQLPRSSDGATPAPLVSISAPELRWGYNKIEISFNSDGSALGLEVFRYRIRPGEQTLSLDQEVSRVNLGTRTASTAGERLIIQEISRLGSFRGSDLLRWASGEPVLDMTALEVESFVRALTWQGIVREVGLPGASFERAGFVI